MYRAFVITYILIYLLHLPKHALFDESNDLYFQLQIIHLNDFHARFEEISPQDSTCKGNSAKCVGGFARLYTVITHLKKLYPDSLLLNGGDNFQGTVWYRYFKWNVTQYFMNMLPWDAFTLGNHDFDDGIAGVVPFIKHLKAPVIDANIDDRFEPDIQGIYKKSTIVYRQGKKIGIIGAIWQNTSLIAPTERLIFLNETESVAAEANKLKNIDQCDIIIVLSHCGLPVDRIIAANAGPNIDIIVGGHSHTFMYHGDNYPGPEKPQADYPVVVEQGNGHRVIIVQASCYSKFVGFINIYFDRFTNDIHHWDGNPIYMSQNVTQDPTIVKLLIPWKKQLDKYVKQTIGETKVVITKSGCYNGDSNVGNMFADSIVNGVIDLAGEDEWTYAAIGFINCGGIRSGFDIGEIIAEDLLAAQPFGNKIDIIELKGRDLLYILENTATGYKNGGWGIKYQISGIHIKYNASRPFGSRITYITVRCYKCATPKYEPLRLESSYRVALADYLIDVGAGFNFKQYMHNRVHTNVLFTDILRSYIAQYSPLTNEKDDRIQIIY